MESVASSPVPALLAELLTWRELAILRTASAPQGDWTVAVKSNLSLSKRQVAGLTG
jgi:hypothetical protein